MAETRKRAPSPGSQQQELLAIVKTSFRKRGILAAIFGLLLAACVLVLTLKFWEPVYDAKQYVRVIQNPEYSEILPEGRTKIEPKDVLAPIRSAFLLEQLLLDPIVRSARPNMDAKRLAKKVSYQLAGGELYTVECRDTSPKYAALIAETLTDKFLAYHRRQRDEDLDKLQETLDKEIENANNVITSIRSQLATLNEQLMISADGDDQVADPEGSYRSDQLKALYDETVSHRQLENETKALRESLKDFDVPIDEANLLVEIGGSEEVLEIDQVLLGLENSKRNLSHLGEKAREIVNLNWEIQQYIKRRQQTIERLKMTRRAAIINAKTLEIGNAIEVNQKELAKIDVRIQLLRAEIDRLTNNLKYNNKIEFQMEQLLRDEERASQRLKNWESARERIDSKDMSLYQVVLAVNENSKEKTVAPPIEPVEQYPLQILGIGIIVALVLPFCASAGWEFRVRRISYPEQIKDNVPVELLGEIADLPTSRGRARLRSKRATQQLRLFEESVDNLSAILSHSREDKPQVLAVTSAASNEGKTTLASQLAMSAARTNFGRTLLIDGDLRSPNLHRLFDGSLDVGLADVLAETESLSDAVLHTEIENLDVLTAGKIRSNPRRYFSDGHWADLLAEARKHYDQIIVDTPPVLAASESLSISKACDCTLVCVLRDVSRSDSVKRAHDRLVAADVKVIGCAFGGVPQNEYASKYGSYGYNLT